MTTTKETPMSAWLKAGGPWLPGMRGFGDLHWKRGAEPYRGRIDVMEGKPCVIVRRWLAKGTCEAIFFATPPTIDETDPATLGAMLGEVRRVWKDPRGVCEAFTGAGDVDGWGFILWDGRGVGPFALTEAEALAAAYAARPEAS